MTERQIKRFNAKVYEGKPFFCLGRKVIPVGNGLVHITTRHGHIIRKNVPHFLAKEIIGGQ